MAISFGSINTGLPKDIVQQIMKAEKVPVEKMKQRKDKFASKQSLVGELEKLVTDLRTHLAQNSSAASFRDLKVETNNDVVGVTVDKNIANTGSHQFEVVQLAQKSSAMSSGFADKDESYVGVGFIQYFLPDGSSKEIYVDSDNASLSGIAKLINDAEDSGMKANVVNDGSGSDSPYRLIISLQETGDGKKAEFPYFYFIDGEDDLYVEFEREAQDAKVKLDGFEIEIPENKTSDLIPGMTIDLKKAKPGEEFTLKVAEDREAAEGKIVDFTEKVNAVLSFIKQQNTLDENSDTSRTLGGDIMLQTIESRLRAVMFQGVKTDYGTFRAGDIGIKFTRDGILEFSKDTFNAKVGENYQMVSQLLTGSVGEDGTRSKGILQNLYEFTNQVLRYPDGILSSRKNGLQSKMNQVDRRIQQRERNLEQKEKNLKDKFARLETTISRLKGQGAGVSALGGGGPSPVQQLG